MSNQTKSHRIYPFFKDGRFYNNCKESRPTYILPTINMIIEWYFYREHKKDIDLSDWFCPSQPVERSERFAITWIGHSTFLIQVGNINILTDPIFGNLTPLFKRLVPCGIAIHELPNIDFILISHNHPDHMNSSTLKQLKKYNKINNAKILVPFNDKQWFISRKFNFGDIFESMWWDRLKFLSEKKVSNIGKNDFQSLSYNDIEFTFLPAYHWSQRGIFDYNKSLWGSWMISVNNINIYFAGDTGYSHHFKSIAQEFDHIDLAIMPIGPCEPHEWMKDVHVNAEEAGQSFLDLKAKHFIPMHWGTYFFGIDNFYLPHDRLINWWENQKFYNQEQLHILKFGERTYIDFNSNLLPKTQLLSNSTI